MLLCERLTSLPISERLTVHITPVLTDMHALEVSNVSTTFNKKIDQSFLQISQELKMWKVLAGDYKRIADIAGEALMAKKQSCRNRIQSAGEVCCPRRMVECVEGRVGRTATGSSAAANTEAEGSQVGK